MIVPPLPRPRSSDEFAPVPWDDRLRHAAALVSERAAALDDRRGTATVLRALDEVAGGDFDEMMDQLEAGEGGDDEGGGAGGSDDE